MEHTIDDARRVSGLLQAPPEARMCYVLAHGAGAGMAHPLMAAVAEGLARRGIATLRWMQGSEVRTEMLDALADWIEKVSA